jgi:hypothetical protein
MNLKHTTPPSLLHVKGKKTTDEFDASLPKE